MFGVLYSYVTNIAAETIDLQEKTKHYNVTSINVYGAKSGYGCVKFRICVVVVRFEGELTLGFNLQKKQYHHVYSYFFDPNDIIYLIIQIKH